MRENFVFILVPIINPDGVYRGHYRTDTQGLNLNRYYLNPNLDTHPAIYAINEVILYHNEEKRLHGYLDLHAHATRKGCFMYGNSSEIKNQLDICLYPRLVSMNTPYFEYEGCNFTE
jgi:hypothetical protein